MEDNTKLLDSLLERVTEYGKTSVELVKLRALDKTTDIVSSIIPHYIIIAFYACFVFFLSVGMAFWLSNILGKTYYGFIVVAAFYALIGIIIHLFMYKWLKIRICNYFIQQLLK